MENDASFAKRPAAEFILSNRDYSTLLQLASASSIEAKAAINGIIERTKPRMAGDQFDRDLAARARDELRAARGPVRLREILFTHRAVRLASLEDLHDLLEQLRSAVIEEADARNRLRERIRDTHDRMTRTIDRTDG